MSHECPECGQTCYCNGDIDDCCLNLPMDINKCKHCQICESKDDEEEDFDLRMRDF